ncbi:THO complex subunit 7 homolog [Contarinia nasturtii]|uniref:THO complex subunit 7 homolog n=1 Tax=Contarinia nasturtii TaxID=265458 RepID=UPI0012D46CED|nr:THO complex subunit 7 homolog [Contarinia nasturtii]
MANDESVIKRRLLIDGDGTGDDRRLNVLLKSFIKWSNTKDTAENTQAAYDRMLGQLAQCEFTVRKSAFCRKMMQDELDNYKDISKAIDGGIEQAKVQITQSKENLVIAKKIRKNRMEYDVLAKVISQQPDRKETMAKLESLKKDLDNLKDSRTKLDQKLENRRNDFTVLMRSIQELQKKLDGEDVTEIDEESGDSKDDIEMMSVDGEILDDSK